MPFSEPVHSQQPLAREGKNISSTSFVVSTSIVEPIVSVYEIDIQGDSDPDPVPPSKLEARKVTGNPSNIQKTKNLALCHAILPLLERFNRLPVRSWQGLSLTTFRIIEWIIHLFIQKEVKVTFLLPSIIILGEDGEVYMPGPRIPVHRSKEHHACCFATSQI